MEERLVYWKLTALGRFNILYVHINRKVQYVVSSPHRGSGLVCWEHHCGLTCRKATVIRFSLSSPTHGEVYYSDPRDVEGAVSRPRCKWSII